MSTKRTLTLLIETSSGPLECNCLCRLCGVDSYNLYVKRITDVLTGEDVPPERFPSLEDVIAAARLHDWSITHADVYSCIMVKDDSNKS